MTLGGRRHALTLIAGLAEAQSPQPAAKVARVGYVTLGSKDSVRLFVTQIQDRLRELGWTAGANVVAELRLAEGRADRERPRHRGPAHAQASC